jgi:hypothetical protein
MTGVWRIVVDGHEGDLIVQSVGSQMGEIVFALSLPAFNITPSAPVVRFGFWDESSQAITLQCVRIASEGAEVVQPSPDASVTFSGHLFRTPPPQQGPPGADVLWTLAGTCVVFGAMGAGIGATSRRHRVGWLATINQTV